MTSHRKGRHRRPSTTARAAKSIGGLTMAGMIAAGVTAAPATAQDVSPGAANVNHVIAHRNHENHLMLLHLHHLRHLGHLTHLRREKFLRTVQLAAYSTKDTTRSSGYYASGGNLSFAGLESLWRAAGGPSWAAWSAATIAECESGGRQYAQNPSGASGYWQILGSVVPGNVFDPMTNAENAVAKFRADGDTFAAWVCRA